MNARTYLRSAGTFFTNGEANAGDHQQVASQLVVRENSTQTTSVGVYVKGSLKVEAGKPAPGIRVVMDPASLRRKIAIEQLQRDMAGLPNAKTTNKR